MNNRLFRFVALVLCFVLVMSFASCSEVKQAQRSFEEMLGALQKGDYITARDAYISRLGGDNDFLGCKNNYTPDLFPAYEMHNELFTTLEYNVIKTVSDEPTKVTFLVEITALDLEPVADELFETTEGFNFMAENNEAEISEEEINAVLTQQMVDISRDYLAGDDRQMKKTQLEVNVCYEKDRVWRVYPDDKLVNVLTGGVYNRYNRIMQEYMSK